MNINNMMPQAKFFFVYIYWDDEQKENPLGTHVVFGFDRESTEHTRKLVQSGSQITMLLYLGPVCELLPHHTRQIRGLTGICDRLEQKINEEPLAGLDKATVVAE